MNIQAKLYFLSCEPHEIYSTKKDVNGNEIKDSNGNSQFVKTGEIDYINKFLHYDAQTGRVEYRELKHKDKCPTEYVFMDLVELNLEFTPPDRENKSRFVLLSYGKVAKKHPANLID